MRAEGCPQPAPRPTRTKPASRLIPATIRAAIVRERIAGASVATLATRYSVPMETVGDIVRGATS